VLAKLILNIAVQCLSARLGIALGPSADLAVEANVTLIT